MSAKILVIEDEADLVRVLQYNLKKEGYAVVSAGTGAEGLRLAVAEPSADLVVLDIMLPDISGIDVCRQIKGDPRTRGFPVLMLTAKSEESDRIRGFEVGADDYVTKPFSVRELMLRVKALLRRGAVGAPSPSDGVFGALRVDRGAHRAWVGKEEVVLTALEFRLLAAFLDRKGRVQTRDALLADVWDIHADVTTRTVDTHVKRLREKLGAAGDYIETVRGVGYRFKASPGEEP
jgi:two-component system phosphate regulon response regulator PhoB